MTCLVSCTRSLSGSLSGLPRGAEAFRSLLLHVMSGRWQGSRPLEHRARVRKEGAGAPASESAGVHPGSSPKALSYDFGTWIQPVLTLGHNNIPSLTGLS